jgi:hypothetical protein
MVINSKGKLYEDVLSQIIIAILKVKDLYIYSAHKAFLALKMKKNENNPSLAKLCIYIIGELATFLINNTTLNCKNETLSVSENDVLNLLKEIGIRHNNLGNETVIEYLLNALVKLFIKFKDKKSEIESMIKHYKRSYFSEVQSRALEYLQFNKSEKEQMKEKMVEAIPIPQKNILDWEKDLKEKRKLVDEKDEENYEPEDDLICVRLTEGVIKNIEINENNDLNENINNGLDFLGEKNDDNNINKQNQGGNLNLLDLDSIFSAAASGNTNPSLNSNQNIQNTNSDSNPFDILNMQLNQNQNNTNDNQKPNSDINDILNLVIGSNGNNANSNKNNIINQNPTTEINSMKQCFKNEDISIYYNITKKEGNNIDGSVYASNNKNSKINGVKISFLVQKFVKLTVLATSGDSLEPNQSLGIKKDFTLTSSEPNKKVILKIKLHYLINDKEQSHEFTIKNI